MHTDKNGTEINVGDIIDVDGIDYRIISKGPCVDIHDEDEVLYGQMVADMRVMIPFTSYNLKNATKVEEAT